jgi:hypothetical protein
MAFDLVINKGTFIRGCYSNSKPQLGSHYGFIRNFRYELLHNHKCSSFSVLAQRATIHVQDDKPLVQNDNKGFHKDINMLPSKLHSFPQHQNFIFFLCFNYHSMFQTIIVLLFCAVLLIIAISPVSYMIIIMMIN